MKSALHSICRIAGCVIVWFIWTAGAGMAQDAPTLPENDQCVICHLDVEEIPEDFLEYDVHLKEPLSCVGCHGGDPTVDDDELAKAPGTGFIGIPSREDIPAMCGRCHSDPAFMQNFQPRIHTDQVDQYRVSVHGQKLAEGDMKVANCTGCHTSHGILPASDARSTVHPLNVPSTCRNCHGDADYMREYGLRTNQYADYVESVHGKALLEEQDLGAPACNDCHGNHGATPPDIASLIDVCGSCHIHNNRYFTESPMFEPFVDNELHACLECHGYHDVSAPTDDKVGVSDAAICMDCHDEGEDAYQVAQQINMHLKGLVTVLDSATTLQKEVVRIGMDDVDIEYLLKDAHQNLIHARTLVHTFDPEKVAEQTTEGVATSWEAIALSHEQFKEHSRRRYGFGIATIFITLLAVGLYMKIREIEAREESEDGS